MSREFLLPTRLMSGFLIIRTILVTNMLNKLHGQPDSYDKKLVAHDSPIMTSTLNINIADQNTNLGKHWGLEPMELFEKPIVLRARLPLR